MPFRPLQPPRTGQPAKPPASPMQAIPSVLGRYDANGRFQFNSAQDWIDWLRKGYRQAINPDAFELGTPLHPDEAAAYASGAVEPPHHAFQGPDGVFRGKNAATAELPDVHDARMKAWEGIRFKDVDPHAEKHIGEDAGLAMMKEAKPPQTRTTQTNTRPIAPEPGHTNSNIQIPTPVQSPATVPANAAAMPANEMDNRPAKFLSPAIPVKYGQIDAEPPTAGQELATLSPGGSAILAPMKRVDRDDRKYPQVLAKLDDGAANDASPATPKSPSLQDTGPYPDTPVELPSAKLTPKRDPVPSGYLKAKAEGKEPWPSIPDDWITSDRRGNPVLTLKASQELDGYKAQMQSLVRQLDENPNLDVGLGQKGDKSLAAMLLKHYLAGDTDLIRLPPKAALLAAPNVASAITALNGHVVTWLLDPTATKRAEEQIVPEILKLKDGESITVPSNWAGATSKFSDLRSLSGSKDAPAGLGHVLVDGTCNATIRREGDRYFATVVVDNILIDRYDFTDADGETKANIYLGRLGLPSVDFAKLALLAETGRAKPYEIRSSWRSSFTAELVPTGVGSGKAGHGAATFALKRPTWNSGVK